MSKPRVTVKPSDPSGAEVSLPPSATHAAVAWSGVICMLVSVALVNWYHPYRQIAYLALLVMAGAALGIFVPDLAWQKVQRRTLASAVNRGDWARTATKCLGLLASVGFVALLYWLTPEYHGSFYDNFYSALKVLAWPWAALAPLYISWVDQRLADPQDSLWQVGRLLSGKWQGLDPRVIWQHLLGWLVKGFFLPLMFTYFCHDLAKLLDYNPELLRYEVSFQHTFKHWYDWSYDTFYFIDVSLVSMTYLMSLKATDTQIRSSEPTALGWMCALACYQPFWSLISAQYIDYDSGGIAWDLRLINVPWLYELWGSLILVLVIIYVWATISFGARFSNLTHRGIITNGPYRYTKHPAYLAKNLSWWMISMPFMFNGSVFDTVRHSTLLLALNLIYYLRAKTEERHLGLDPVYLQYAKWIDRHGLLRWVNRLPIIGQLARWRPAFKTYTPPTPLS